MGFRLASRHSFSGLPVFSFYFFLLFALVFFICRSFSASPVLMRHPPPSFHQPRSIAHGVIATLASFIFALSFENHLHRYLRITTHDDYEKP